MLNGKKTVKVKHPRNALEVGAVGEIISECNNIYIVLFPNRGIGEYSFKQLVDILDGPLKEKRYDIDKNYFI